MNNETDLSQPALFINRELSWLSFNARVLEEAQDRTLPLFERLKFLGIFSSNLDEFFMVRVAGLKQQLAGGVTETPADGMLPAEQLRVISEYTHELVAAQYALWRDELVPELAEVGIRILPAQALSSEQADYCRERFMEDVFPALTPLAVDSGHPFPQLRNKSLNIGVLLQEDRRRARRRPREAMLAVVQVPRVFNRLVPLPSDRQNHFVLLGTLIAMHVGELFPGFRVVEAATFRVTRNWDLSIDEEESEDLLATVEEELRHRDRGAAVRLELEMMASDSLEAQLSEALHLDATDVYRLDGPLQINDLAELSKLDPRLELRLEPFVPVMPSVFGPGGSVFERIRARDILLHHPYESFEPVVRFLDEAADDPDVLAIKQTLYRTGVDLPIMRALCRAAYNGKQVAALVEIKARFDEEQNIAWGRRMEDAGVHVIYGVIGLKTHCKVALVVRREGNGVRRYVHLGTGNYNLATARQYTDVSLLTADHDIAEDASALFNLLTGYSRAPTWRQLVVAPFNLHEALLASIGGEIAAAQRGEPARIRAKMNALVDPEIIRALYRASQAGVDVGLAIRGICCLRPGLPGVSDRIRVVSVLDRFLEHSRVFAFGPDDRAKVYLSSADWMPRNFFRRVEVMVPVLDAQLRQRLLDEVLGLALRDNAKARQLQPDGDYTSCPAVDVPLRSQSAALEVVRLAREEALGNGKSRTPALPSPSRRSTDANGGTGRPQCD